MNGIKKNYEQLSTTVPPKFLKLLRLQAFKADTSLSDMLGRYQASYLREVEWDKTKKVAEKEKKCPYCER